MKGRVVRNLLCVFQKCIWGHYLQLASIPLNCIACKEMKLLLDEGEFQTVRYLQYTASVVSSRKEYAKMYYNFTSVIYLFGPMLSYFQCILIISMLIRSIISGIVDSSKNSGEFSELWHSLT